MTGLPETTDILIIGSGIGGATLAAGLAGTGAKIAILERGRQLADSPAARDARAIFVDGAWRPKESWVGADGKAFSPGNYYFVGGNSKFYGAVHLRYRERDFEAFETPGGLSPAWPFAYGELEPWYGRAEHLFQVHGTAGEDSVEPARSTPYPCPPVPDEPAIAKVRERLKAAGLHPFTLPLAVDIERWLAHGKTPWDAFPDTRSGKFDAETAALAKALRSSDVSLHTDTFVERLLVDPDGRRIAGVEVISGGERRTIRARFVVVSAGAVNSAALLLRSATDSCPTGIANRSDAVGRHFMNHNCTAMLAVDPRQRNDSVYQKTLGINDFYFEDGARKTPLGNVQLLGRVTAPILKANLRYVPESLLGKLSDHAVDWYLMSEDLPQRDSRVTVDGGRIRLDWRRSNMAAHEGLKRRMKERFRAAGYPIVLSRTFDRRTPSHQCGTVVFGTDPAASALDPFCRAHDHDNLFVVDASFLPTSAAVNPALTIAAQALRVADHIASTELD